MQTFIIILFIVIFLIMFLNFISKEYVQNTISHHSSGVISNIYKTLGKNNCVQTNSKNILKCSVDSKIFFCDKNDSIVSASIRAGIPWESFMHQYFKKFSNKNKIDLDIGANIGTHTIYLSKYFKEVHGFEPQRKVFDLLKSNIEINNCHNVKLHNFGLGEKNEIVQMQKFDENSDYNQGGVGIDLNENDEPKGEEIYVKVLDELNLKDVGFIKLDVEGYEYFVLKGGERTISISRPIVIIELNHKTKEYRKDIFQFFKKLRYKLTRISWHDYIAIPN